MSTKTIPTLDVVSAYTGVLANDMDGLYAVLNYLTGDNLFTHQLPRASVAVAPSLLRQFPWLADLTRVDRTAYADQEDFYDAFGDWCEAITEKHGRFLEVEPATDLEWQSGTAFSDLVEMMGDRP